MDFDQLLPEILPDVPGCADPIAIRAIRNAVVEFCERTALYRSTLAAIDVVADTAEYALAAPAGYAVVDVRRATLDGYPLTFKSQDQLDREWNEDARGMALYLYHRKVGEGLDAKSWQTAVSDRPQTYFMTNPSTIRLVGIPTTAITGGLLVTVALKPTPAATQIVDWLYNDYYRTLAYGALAELLKLPKKPWTDMALASHYHRLFNEGIEKAHGESLRDHGRDDQTIRRIKAHS